MATYIVRRLLGMIPMLFFITLFVFLLMHAAPGNAIQAAVNPHVKNQGELIARLRHNAGLDMPLWKQYITWLSNFFQGQWGWSFVNNEPVVNLVLPALRNTLTLAIVAEVFILLVGIPVGIRQARHPYGKFDNTATFL